MAKLLDPAPAPSVTSNCWSVMPLISEVATPVAKLVESDCWSVQLHRRMYGHEYDFKFKRLELHLSRRSPKTEMKTFFCLTSHNLKQILELFTIVMRGNDLKPVCDHTCQFFDFSSSSCVALLKPFPPSLFPWPVHWHPQAGLETL